MQHSAKYLIHAEIRTDGVVERSDVVGAVFGQTEGLLGDELDLRDLQDSSKVGRIDVDIDSAEGRSFGTFTVASGLDRVETAVLAASFETIDRVGPCRAECTVVEIEDVRAAKRRQVVDRATELLTAFEAQAVTGERLINEVRKRARVEEITEYAGLPAGPHVASSDAVIIVEGRADVKTLLQYGIKNAVAVEGTNIPEEIAQLTSERTTTAFLDGDRGGDLILRELQQVGDVDYVAFAPTGRSVEDLDRNEIRAALHKKIPAEQVTGEMTPREVFAPTDGGVAVEHPTSVAEPETPDSTDQTAEVEDDDLPSDEPSAGDTSTESQREPDAETASEDGAATADGMTSETADGTTSAANETDTESAHETTAEQSSESETAQSKPTTLAGHTEAVLGSGTVRLLDSEFSILADGDGASAFDLIAQTDPVARTVILDGPITQQILDIAAQRGVGQVIGTAEAEFVKQPANVRVRTVETLD